jgi:hypothetical protein
VTDTPTNLWPVPEPELVRAARLRDELNRIGTQLRGLVVEFDATGPLPGPTRYVAAGEDGPPGARWATGWSLEDGPIEVLCTPDDTADGGPAMVYVRGLTYGGDITCLSPDEAVRVGRAFLGAAAMAGSAVIAKRVAEHVLAVAPKGNPRRR